MRSRDGENSDGFIREVDEAVRQDRLMAVWKQYGTYIVGASLAVVVGVAASVGWQNYQESQRAGHARAMAEATALLAEDKPAEAAAAFKALADDVGGGVAVVARLRAAGAEKEAGSPEAKLGLLEDLSDNQDASSVYRRLADLLVRQEAFNDSDADALIDELDQAAAPDNPWRSSLIELKAIAQMKAGRVDEARATLETLLESETTPDNMQRRAAELLRALGGPLNGDNQTVSQNDTDGDGGDAAVDGEAAE